ncbi:uncharacterized protein M437DRAFT_83335 [Aureobasidium melanogenum CBS 110374]|uniref:Uncharacterized protein n=1 Tax=Aureobasidium melanogenum (strain CBS 110374) TaxID=1043003 RepID=A0A074VUE0_AURM1|nr:uncharacterized protein M437DRAFT_83335 [Aureobasidium melanogenum CBS 110374]KEQ64400.1 hypothetical protein M437DRAFT_83335 [Aureobasidium melanogenum CBS 110374]
MTSIEEERAVDGSKEDPRHEGPSGSVDVANEAEVDTTTTSSPAPNNEPSTNTSNNAETAPLVDIVKLQEENTFLKNDRTRLIQLANTELHRLRTLIVEKDASISVAKKSIAGKQKQLDSLYATLQRQEKKITNQVNEIATLKQKQAAKFNKIRLRMNLMAKRSKKRFERHMAENVYDVREWADQVKALIKQETDSERDSDYEEDEEVDSEDEDEIDGQAKGAQDREMVVIEINDDDEVASAGQATGNEQSAIVQQSDTDEQPTTAQQSIVNYQLTNNEQTTVTEQPASNGQLTVDEQPDDGQQSVTSEQPTLAQQPIVAEQSAATGEPLTTEQTDTSEEHPSKRVKFTEEA